MGSCQITKNQINLDLIEIIQFWTFFGHFCNNTITHNFKRQDGSGFIGENGYIFHVS